VAFANAADRWIARHLPSVSTLWVNRRVREPMRARQARLGASVAATDHDDIEFDGKLHGDGAILRPSFHVELAYWSVDVRFHVEQA